MADYTTPVDKLLGLGDPEFNGVWLDYRALGLGPENIPDLVRMVQDPAGNKADIDDPVLWASLHAWRALGQFRAVEAVEPLLTLLSQQDNDEDQYDDWAHIELPLVFGMIGPTAIPALAAYIADKSRGKYSRAAAAEGLGHIAKAFPEAHADCVSPLIRQLEAAIENDPALNGFYLSPLLDLHAVEAAPVIERAFAADAVDPTIAGGWDDVQWELGLTDKPPQRRIIDLRGIDPGFPGEFEIGGRVLREKKAKAKAKAKRKQAAKARKRNRKGR